jgi:His/Glu/Gln/Arg/opine family amino acid ABC transporter permease subunit
MKGSAHILLAAWMVLLAALGCGERERVIARPDDARDARIGVMTGSTGEAIARKRFPDAKIKSFDDIMDAVAAMKSGQLDVAVTGFPAALQLAKKNRDLRLLPEPLDHEDTAVALRKGDTELLVAVNRIIAELKADGTLESMKRRWFKADLAPYEEPTIDLPEEGEALKIGVSATREPFSFVDRNGRVTGHDGELARRIAARLRRPVEFLDMKFMALIPALDSGKVDLIVTGMTATEERGKQVSFSAPYYANAQVMIVKAGAAQSTSPGAAGARRKLASAEDLKGKRIGVLLGSMHDRYATEHYAAENVLQYKSPSDLMLAVKTGKIDAGFWTTESLMEMLRHDDAIGVLGGPLVTVPIGMGLRKDDDRLRERFNDFLRRIRADGTYADMIDRWMTRGSRTMPEIANSKTDGVLVVGIISDDGYPFTVVQDGTLIGFDVEMAERFAAYLGKDIKRVDMEFGSLIAAVSTGKIDMIASTLIITEERMRQIAFTDPYYEIGMSAFALRENIAAYEAAPAAGAMPFLRRLANSFRSNILQENRYRLILSGLGTTVVISVCATCFGSLLGALVCFMRMSKRSVLNVPARAYIAILRGTPVLVVLMLVFYVVFASVDIDPVLVAIVAFGMNFAAYVAEIFRTGIEGVDKGQTEAGLAMGFSRLATFWYIVMPQTIRRILPVYKGEFISLVKMTSIVGYIAVQDLTKASDIIRSRTFDAFFPLILVAILYFVISWVLMQALEWLERLSDPKWRRRRAVHA